MDTKKFLLQENDIPRAWYNIVADMKNKPMPPLHPGTKKPLQPEDLYPIFAKELVHQELNTTDAWIEIPDEIRDMYKVWRPTPLVRAYGLEKALDTPAHRAISLIVTFGISLDLGFIGIIIISFAFIITHLFWGYNNRTL